MWAKWAKIGDKTRFFAIFSSSLVFCEVAKNDSLQQFITSSRAKRHEKTFVDQIGAQS